MVILIPLEIYFVLVARSYRLEIKYGGKVGQGGFIHGQAGVQQAPPGQVGLGFIHGQPPVQQQAPPGQIAVVQQQPGTNLIFGIFRRIVACFSLVHGIRRQPRPCN